MFLARVKGHVVATAKDPAINGWRLLIVEPLKVDYTQDSPDSPEPANSSPRPDTRNPIPSPSSPQASSLKPQASFANTGRAIVAMDSLGAGIGQLVLVVQGSSARLAEGMNKIPTDAVIVGIVDQALVGNQPIT